MSVNRASSASAAAVVGAMVTRISDIHVNVYVCGLMLYMNT